MIIEQKENKIVFFNEFIIIKNEMGRIIPKQTNKNKTNIDKQRQEKPSKDNEKTNKGLWK